MAAVEPRPKINPKAWRVRWRLDGRRDGEWQSVTVTKSAKEADRIALMIEAYEHRLTRAQVIAMQNPARNEIGKTVAAFCRGYIDTLSITGGTRREYERSIRLHIEPTPLGRADLAAVTREDVRKWIRAEEKNGAAPKSIANHHGLLSAALEEAVNDGLIAANPCRGVRLPRRDDRTDADDEMCFLTPQEVDLIAKAMPKKYAPIVWILARTGLRWSELTALQVGDIDLMAKPPTLTVRRAWKHYEDKGWVLGPPKTKKSRRTITVDRATFDMLLSMVAGKTKREFVVTTRDWIRALPHATFRKAWQKALYGPEKPKGEKRDGGLAGEGLLEKRPTIHDLRHTHASWLLDDPKVTMIRVQRRLGHESLLTTEGTYGHLRRGNDEAILAALDGLTSADETVPALR